MAQMSVYFPDEVEARVRARSAELGKSVSAYLTDLARRDGAQPSEWPESFLSCLGGWKGPAPEIEDMEPEEVDF